jgi:hypothetical protein
MYLFQKSEFFIRTVEGFEQLGDNPTPYTLRGGGQNKSDVEAIHASRPDVDQQTLSIISAHCTNMGLSN